MGRYSDTNVERSGILLLKMEQNGGFLEFKSLYIFARNGCQRRSDLRVGEDETPPYCEIQAKIMLNSH
jgi:hypothetical protein